MSTRKFVLSLDDFTDALRNDPVPEPDWNKVEQKLFHRIDELELSRRAKRPSSPFERVFALAIAASVMAIGASRAFDGAASTSGREHTVEMSSIPKLEAVSPATELFRGDELDAAVLRSGDRLSTMSESRSFGHRELAVRWTLGKNSAIKVIEQGKNGIGERLTLERGALRAEVVPRAASENMGEAFSIDAGATRIAVHGTAFTVKYAGDEVIVDVEHGIVAVGPAGNLGITNGRLLVGPSRAAFSLDGGTKARFLPRDEVLLNESEPVESVGQRAEAQAQASASAEVEPLSDVKSSTLSPAKGAATVAARPIAEHAGQGPAEATTASPEAVPAKPSASTQASEPASQIISVGSIQSGLANCFARHYPPSDAGLMVTISSTFSAVVGEDGRVVRARFSPPLRPEFQDCASHLISGRFVDGSREVTIPLSFSR